MSDETHSTAVAEVEEKVAPTPDKKAGKPKRQPRYHVVLWNDNDHSFEYVILMMKKLFGHTPEKGFEIAKQVDTQGRAICLTTTREHAELKRDQVHGFGPDKMIPRCKGAMSCSIEPEN